MIKKENLGTFDSISTFDAEYIMVERNGYYNLIDNNGEYLSNKWFKEITKKIGGVDFVTKESERIQLHSPKMWSSHCAIRAKVRSTSMLSALDTRCVAVVVPMPRYSRTTSRNITIVAKVNLFGKELLIGQNGKLYTECDNGVVEEYYLPSFSISHTDINRIANLMNKFNCTYNPIFNPNSVSNNTNITRIRKEGICGFVFGYNSVNYCFDTSQTNAIVGKATTKPWGGETIKLRFDMYSMPTLYREKFISKLLAIGFKEFVGKTDHKFNHLAYTKEFNPNELGKLYECVEKLIKKEDFI